MEEYKSLNLVGYSQDSKIVDRQNIFTETSKILIDTINLTRKCQYMKNIGLSETFNKYYDEATDKFDYSRTNEFVAEFKEKVPLSEYDAYKELIDKIHDNCEPNLVLPGLPFLFALRFLF